jgi:hypothetical protein
MKMLEGKADNCAVRLVFVRLWRTVIIEKVLNANIDHLFSGNETNSVIDFVSLPAV